MTNPKSMRLAGRVARIRRKLNSYKVLIGKLEEKRLLGEPRRR
jgi:hypothetical protein